MRGPGGARPSERRAMAATSPRRGLEKNTKLFSGFHFVFLGSKHASRLKTLLEERGAVVEDDFSLSTGHYGVLGEGAGSGQGVVTSLVGTRLLCRAHTPRETVKAPTATAHGPGRRAGCFHSLGDAAPPCLFFALPCQPIVDE